MDSDVEVRREDQLKINEFGRLNAKVHEKRADRNALQKAIEELDDATTELAVGDGDDVKLMLGGEAFVDVSEDFATEHCEAMRDKYQVDLDKLADEIRVIEDRQKILKVDLYGRFGSNINLEEK
mmetsp:Transcript_1263/g.3210  ORF Transcript_1263/g.3210 Transcript_1263/m.3210 type:complete len:124 (-) Transcript_1263:70-441(-)|eukprot:CAMPEP_0197429174 /NCGR_PEP_ID=MMETSP1170-20131217/43135_1 /TAXON_ID=54406 /ORGANISM="Sarcinochrysis sp, Strain CCMP770" /LENGTH=123 /DNA_ID=CAMNT_0042956993 /DNA_START=48 /DNA_END=419 /DNA_ORIENTATION=+